MLGSDFSKFIEVHGWTDAEACDLLGIGSHNTLMKYKADGAPRLVQLACAAVDAGLKSWKFPPSFEFVVSEHDFRFPLRDDTGSRFEGCRKCGCSRAIIERENLQCIVPDVLFRRPL